MTLTPEDMDTVFISSGKAVRMVLCDKVADELEKIDSKLSVIASKNKQDKMMKQALRYEIKELISTLRGNGK